MLSFPILYFGRATGGIRGVSLFLRGYIFHCVRLILNLIAKSHVNFGNSVPRFRNNKLRKGNRELRFESKVWGKIQYLANSGLNLT